MEKNNHHITETQPQHEDHSQGNLKLHHFENHE